MSNPFERMRRVGMQGWDMLPNAIARETKRCMVVATTPLEIVRVQHDCMLHARTDLSWGEASCSTLSSPAWQFL